MDYFLHPISKTEAARVPFPRDLPLEKRAAFMAKPDAQAIAAAERIALAPVVVSTPTED